MVWTHKCRIFRPRLTQAHDLSLLRNAEDIYEEDKDCRVMPADDVLLEIPEQGELGLSGTTAELWVPTDVDVDVGYVLYIRKRKVVNGEVLGVQAQVSINAAIGATTFYLDNVVGFSSGDVINIDTSGTGVLYFYRVKTVNENSVTVYADNATEVAITAGVDVGIGTYYKVFSMKIDGEMGPVRKVVARQIAHSKSVNTGGIMQANF